MPLPFFDAAIDFEVQGSADLQSWVSIAELNRSGKLVSTAVIPNLDPLNYNFNYNYDSNNYNKSYRLQLPLSPPFRYYRTMTRLR